LVLLNKTSYSNQPGETANSHGLRKACSPDRPRRINSPNQKKLAAPKKGGGRDRKRNMEKTTKGPDL